MRKNNWEEALFKREDEMYDFDLNVMQFKMCMKLIEKA